MSTDFTLRFWGVRGSLPSPGPNTVRFGGNTSCLSIEKRAEGAHEYTVVLDAGTGIRQLGHQLSKSDRPIYLVISHTHWDHIHGYPFFDPATQQERTLHCPAGPIETAIIDRMLSQIDGVRFPLSLDQLPSRIKQAGPQDPFPPLKRFRVNHPGESWGVRVELGDTVLAYIPDNELNAPEPKVVTESELLDSVRNADVLVHDAHYLSSEIESRRGWGHSSIRDVCQFALEAGIGHLILFHHHPDRTDDAIDAIQEEARRWLKEQGSSIRCDCAYEGMTLDL